MAQNDLARDAGQAHEAEGPRRVAWAETDLDQVLGLVHLHRVPGEEAGEESEHDPPEASSLYRPPQRPVHGRPGRIHDIRWPTLGFGGGERAGALGLQSHVLGGALEQQIERGQEREHEDAHGPARRAPTPQGAQRPEPGGHGVWARSQPNSSRMGGKSREKAVRALTPTPMVMKHTATMTQP